LFRNLLCRRSEKKLSSHPERFQGLSFPPSLVAPSPSQFSPHYGICGSRGSLGKTPCAGDLTPQIRLLCSRLPFPLLLPWRLLARFLLVSLFWQQCAIYLAPGSLLICSPEVRFPHLPPDNLAPSFKSHPFPWLQSHI